MFPDQPGVFRRDPGRPADPGASHPETENDAPRFVPVLGLWRKTPVAGSRDERIAAIAGLQQGRVARSQLLEAGLSSGAIGRCVAAGRLRVEHPGVYAVGHDAPMPLAPETSALLAAGPGVVLSHHTAAAIWGIRPGGGRRPIDLLVPRDSRPSIAGATVHRTRSLDRSDVRFRHRLPLTSPARTLADVTSDLTDRDLERALDQAIVDRIVRRSQVRATLERLPRHPGRARLLALLTEDSHPTVTRSEAEELLLDLVRRAGLPPPVLNTRMFGYEVDAYWPEQRLAVEVDGFAFHSTQQRIERDHAKDAALRQAGIDTMRITWRQLREQPYAVVAWIAQALSRAAA